MVITLADLRRRVRERADMEDSEFVTDSELNQYINSSWYELYDILVSAYEDYFTGDPVESTIANGSSNFDLPADFYKMRGIDFKFSNTEWATIGKFQFHRRNRNNQTLNSTFSRQLERRYRIVGTKVRMIPDDSAEGTYRLWYIPQPTELATDTDELPQIAIGSGWEEYVVVDAAIKALSKEESDVSVLLNNKGLLLERILAMSKNRDVGEPDRIGDTDTQYSDRFWEF